MWDGGERGRLNKAFEVLSVVEYEYIFKNVFGDAGQKKLPISYKTNTETYFLQIKLVFLNYHGLTTLLCNV